jgi:FSR family fosmidomycin resistance protein-like MFS transporter
MQNRIVAMLSLGHLVTDINQGALPALLPFLIAEYHLSYTAAAFIIFSSTVASTVVQPVFGHLADRISTPWLMPAGIFLAGVGLAGTGIVSHYSGLLISVMLSGVGIAAFHPQGAQFVNRVSGAGKATAMSVFGVGGTLGFAIGPGFVTAILLHWGLKGTALMVIPTSIMAGVLAWRLASTPETRGDSKRGKAVGFSGEAHDAWGPFARLTAAVMARSILFFGLNTFVPLYWIHVLHASKAAGALALVLFALASVVGNLLGGRLADRFGYSRIAVAGFCALIPLIPAFVGASREHAALAVLMMIGLVLSTTYSPLIILGQQYLPNHIGLSSGVTLGIAITFGGATTPLLGQVADRAGLWVMFASMGIVPILAAGLALTLPRPDPAHTHSPAGT